MDLIESYCITLEQGKEICVLGRKQGFSEGVLKLLSENMQYQELILKAIKAGEGSNEQQALIKEMEAFNERQFCEATSEIEKARENARKYAVKLEKARENEQRAAARLEEVLKNEQKGK